MGEKWPPRCSKCGRTLVLIAMGRTDEHWACPNPECPESPYYRPEDGPQEGGGL